MPAKKKSEKTLIKEISKLAAEVTLGETEVKLKKKKAEPKPAKSLRNVEWPTVTKGSHLTVYTYENGSTKLEWDDKALLRDVQNALTEHEKSAKVVKTKPLRTKKSKNET